MGLSLRAFEKGVAIRFLKKRNAMRFIEKMQGRPTPRVLPRTSCSGRYAVARFLIIRPFLIGQGYNPSVIFGDSKLLRCPKYSPAFALNILTAAPNLARFIVHRTRFASFAPREGLICYPRAMSRIIIRAKPIATPIVAILLCSPSWDSGISSSTTT